MIEHNVALGTASLQGIPVVADLRQSLEGSHPLYVYGTPVARCRLQVALTPFRLLAPGPVRRQAEPLQ